MERPNNGWRMFLVFISIAVFFFIDASEATSSPEAVQNASQTTIKNPLEDTVRVDPIKHFRKYRGGYDIRNKHYWSSTAFTGVSGYAIGLIWIFIGAVCGGILLVRRLYFNQEPKERPTCDKKCFIKNPILAAFIAALAIVATGVALSGSVRYDSRSRTILRIILKTEDDATQAIRNTTRTLDTISKNLASGYVVGGYKNVSMFIKTESDNLNSKADNIERLSRRTRRSIGKGLTAVFIITLVAVSMNMVLVLLLSVFGVLRFRRTTIVLIALCWILTGLCWSLFGTYFFLENFSKDTCTALSDFQKNPKNSSLGSILPCNSLASTGSILRRVGINIHDLVNKANKNISTLRNTTYPGLMFVCNPFSGPPDYLFQPENCPFNTIKIGDIPQALEVFKCPESNNVSCSHGGFISNGQFDTIEAVTSSIQSLLDAYPLMQSLVECQLVKDSFSTILNRECRPWKAEARFAWLATLFLSVVMSSLVFMWAVRAHHHHKFHPQQGRLSLRQLNLVFAEG